MGDTEDEKIGQEAGSIAKAETKTALNDEGITVKALAKELKQSLKSKEIKVIKIKGALLQKDLPKGFKLIGTSGVLSYAKEGEEIYGDGETLIRYDPEALGIRQNARIDAQKLLNMYPNERITLTHNLTEHTKKLLSEIDGQSRTVLPSEEDE